MATTTNFGWETPDDTDLVKDGALAMRTLGNAIDASFVDLKGGTTGQVLSKNSNTDLDFIWVTSDDANAIQNAIVDAKGDLITATAADTPARLAVGTNGQVLTVDSTTATGLKWATPAGGGGKVLQVVQATNSTEVQVASTTFTDTGLSVTITPSATTSKILIIASQQFAVQRSSNAAGGGLRLLRGATEILDNDGASDNSYFAIDQGSGPTFTYGNTYNPVIYLDSPSTTSATTYKTQIRSYTTANSGSVWAQVGNAVSSIIALEIGA